MEFEWDEDKNIVNRSKHGIDFRDAVHVFVDQRSLIREDNRHYGEQRFQLIGMARFGVLFVVYTERVDDIIRIISARAATKVERKMYRDGSFF